MSVSCPIRTPLTAIARSGCSRQMLGGRFNTTLPVGRLRSEMCHRSSCCQSNTGTAVRFAGGRSADRRAVRNLQHHTGDGLGRQPAGHDVTADDAPADEALDDAVDRNARRAYDFIEPLELAHGLGRRPDHLAENSTTESAGASLRVASTSGSG